MKTFFKKSFILFMILFITTSNVYCNKNIKKPKFYYCEGNPKHIHINGVCPYEEKKKIANKINNTFTKPKIYFNVPPTKINLDPFLEKNNAIDNRIKLKIGDNIFLSAVVEPNKKINEGVTWEAEDYNIATIDKDNNLIANSVGTTTISANTYNGLKKFFTLEVLPIEADSIKIDQKEINIVKGDTYHLSATITPENTTNKNITWKSSNNKIVTVKNGVIKANKIGKVIITAETSNGKTDTIEFKVKLDKVKLTLYLLIVLFVLFTIFGILYIYKLINQTFNNKDIFSDFKHKINIKAKKKNIQKNIKRNIEYGKREEKLKKQNKKKTR